MSTRRSGISRVWQPARGRHRATMVEGRLRRGGRPDRTRWLPELAASRERLVVSAVQPASSSSS